MSDSSRHSSVGYSTHASGYSRASSSSYFSDNSFSQQQLVAAPQFQGGYTSGSTSGDLQQFGFGKRRRRLHERPSLFTSFPKEYDTKVFECDDIFISSTFKVQDLEEEILKVIQGETVICPRTLETSNNENLNQVVRNLKLYHKTKGAFICGGSSLMVLFNKHFFNLQKCTENIVCDLCIFTLGSPPLILTVVENDKNGHLLKDYNALLAQEIHTHVRKDVVGFRTCNGVITVEDCHTFESFDIKMKTIKQKDEVRRTYLLRNNLAETVLSFLKMIAKCSGSDGDERYVVGRMFVYFMELMQESNNVLVRSSSFDFSITLLSVMVERLVLAGKISLVVKGFGVIPELHELGKRHRNSVLLMYEQPSNSEDMQDGDICLTSSLTGDRKWIFKTGPRDHMQHAGLRSPQHDPQVEEGTVEAKKSLFENMKCMNN